jgi:hypothetical protein
MNRVTYDGLRSMNDCLRISEDIIFLPDPKYFLRDENLMKPASTLWKSGFTPEVLPEELRNIPWENPTYVLGGALSHLPEFLSDEIKRTGKNPPWYRFCSDKFKRYLNYIRSMIEIDPVAIEQNYVPYATDNGYIIEEGGLADDAIRALGLRRLQGINMWGNICDAATQNEGQSAFSYRFHHTRFCHSLDVLTGMGIFTHNHRRMLPQDEINNLHFEALTHDGMTPAGGDGTMAVDSRLSEEAAYTRYFSFPTWPRLEQKYHLYKQRLVNTIRGIGWRGILLSLIDRIFYVARDIDVLLERYGKTWPLNATDTKYKIMDLALRHPDICRLWEDIRLSPDFKVYLTNPDNLFRFLLMRLHLSTAVYYNAGNRNLESILSGTVIPYLLEESRSLDFNFFFKNGDAELDNAIGEFIGKSYGADNPYQLGTPRWKTYTSKEKATRDVKELFRRGIIFINLEDLTGKIKTGANTLIDDGSGKIMPFSEVFPDKTRELEENAVIKEPIMLHWVEDPKIDPLALKKLRDFKEKTWKGGYRNKK